MGAFQQQAADASRGEIGEQPGELLTPDRLDGNLHTRGVADRGTNTVWPEIQGRCGRQQGRYPMVRHGLEERLLDLDAGRVRPWRVFVSQRRQGECVQRAQLVQRVGGHA